MTPNRDPMEVKIGSSVKGHTLEISTQFNLGLGIHFKVNVILKLATKAQKHKVIFLKIKLQT